MSALGRLCCLLVLLAPLGCHDTAAPEATAATAVVRRFDGVLAGLAPGLDRAAAERALDAAHTVHQWRAAPVPPPPRMMGGCGFVEPAKPAFASGPGYGTLEFKDGPWDAFATFTAGTLSGVNLSRTVERQADVDAALEALVQRYGPTAPPKRLPSDVVLLGDWTHGVTELFFSSQEQAGHFQLRLGTQPAPDAGSPEAYTP